MLYSGWTPDYCLAMPARRFFAMLEAGRRVYVWRLHEQCRIAGIATHIPEYQVDLMERYERMMRPDATEEPQYTSNGDAKRMLTAALGGRG